MSKSVSRSASIIGSPKFSGANSHNMSPNVLKENNLKDRRLLSDWEKVEVPDMKSSGDNTYEPLKPVMVGEDELSPSISYN